MSISIPLLPLRTLLIGVALHATLLAPPLTSQDRGSVPPSAAVEQATRLQGAISALRERLQSDVATDNIGGITAAIVLGDRIAWAEGFGMADRERGVPAGVETLYRIGSISKSFTGVLLAQLVQSGRVSLHDPLTRHLPEGAHFSNPPAGSTPVTLLQLASHTAGLIREPRLQNAASGPIAQWEEKIIASIPTTAFDTAPGARYSYSNIGYGVLGLALSRAAGKGFMELVDSSIFAPLGMLRSTFVVPARYEHLLSVGYSNSGADINTDTPAREHLGRGYKVPNGGIYSNVIDLARFMGGVSGALGDIILDAPTRRLLLARHTPTPGTGYGLGFSLQNVRGVAIAGHGGSVAGYTAHLAFDTASGTGVILLRNYNSGRTNLGSVANETIAAILGR